MNNNLINKLNRLESKVTELIGSNEYETVSIKGVSNISRSDLETVLSVIEQVRLHGVTDWVLIGNAGDIIQAYGIELSEIKGGGSPLSW